MEKGLIHIYCGDGKGKTTAGTGLCIRAAGSGKKAVICRFLKDSSSSEGRVLEKIPGIILMKLPDRELFSRDMDDDDRRERREEYRERLEEALRLCAARNADVLMLDEVLYAVRAGLLDEDVLMRALADRPAGLEVILTGRDPGEALVGMADYVTEMKKIKHPFDKGITARDGIER